MSSYSFQLQGHRIILSKVNVLIKQLIKILDEDLKHGDDRFFSSNRIPEMLLYLLKTEKVQNKRDTYLPHRSFFGYMLFSVSYKKSNTAHTA